MKKKLFALLMTTVLVLGLAACTTAPAPASDSAPTGSSQSTPTNAERPVARVYIKWTEAQMSNWPALIEEYNADATNPVIIEAQFFGSEGYDDKVKAELTGDNPPEIVQLMKTTFNEYAANGDLMELSPVITDNGWDYNEGALAWAGPLENPNKEVFGIPDFANTSCIFYNVKLFEELKLDLPTDVESLKTVSKKLNDAGHKAIVTGATNWCASDLIAKVQAQAVGSELLVKANKGEAKYNDPTMVSALEIINDLVQGGAIDKSSADYTDDDAIAEFVSGKAAMYTAHTGMASAIDTVSKGMDFSYDIIEKFNFVENPLTSASVTWGSMWCIPKNVKNPEAAKAALSFLWSEKVAKSDVVDLGKIVNVDSWNAGLTHPVSLTASKQLAGAGTSDSFYLLDMVSPKVMDNLNKGIQEMIQGKATPQQVLDNVQAISEEELLQK
ncbi:MAG: extracellular solute-binding protein [Angelakisella sp.]